MSDRSRDSIASACPDEARLASFIDARLPAAEMRQTREHLVGCGACRTAVADIVRDLAALTESPQVPIPADVRRRVEGLVPPRAVAPVSRPPARGRWAALTAAALMAVFALVKFWHRPVPPSSNPVGPPDSHEVPDMRGGSEETFTTLSPKDQASLSLKSPAALVLEWSAYGGASASPESLGSEGGAAYYVATVREPSGRVVWSGRTAATQISLPPDVRFVPGAAYTWSVVAHLTFGTSQETRTATFSVSR